LQPPRTGSEANNRAFDTGEDFFEVTRTLLGIGRSFSKLIVKQKRSTRVGSNRIADDTLQSRLDVAHRNVSDVTVW